MPSASQPDHADRWISRRVRRSGTRETLARRCSSTGTTMFSLPEPLDEWITPPFSPSLRDGRIYARGSGDNKGPHFAHLKAIESFLSDPREIFPSGSRSCWRGKKNREARTWPLHRVQQGASRGRRRLFSRRAHARIGKTSGLSRPARYRDLRIGGAGRQPGLPFRQGRRGAQPCLGAGAAAGDHEGPAGTGFRSKGSTTTCAPRRPPRRKPCAPSHSTRIKCCACGGLRRSTATPRSPTTTS